MKKNPIIKVSGDDFLSVSFIMEKTGSTFEKAVIDYFEPQIAAWVLNSIGEKEVKEKVN